LFTRPFELPGEFFVVFVGGFGAEWSSVNMAISPYAAADEDKLAEINRLAEARLAAQLTLGVAADQRAMTLASFLATLDAAVIAVLATKPTSAHYAVVALVVGFAIAAGIAAFSAQPVAWAAPGNEPSAWLEDIVEGDSLHNGHAAMAGHYDLMIRTNDAALGGNANKLRFAFLVMIMTLVMGAALAVIG
jgi:hypothetical protein